MQLNVRVIVITVHCLPTHRIILHNEIVITATVRLMTDGEDDNDDRNDDGPRSQSVLIDKSIKIGKSD